MNWVTATVVIVAIIWAFNHLQSRPKNNVAIRIKRDAFAKSNGFSVDQSTENARLSIDVTDRRFIPRTYVRRSTITNDTPHSNQPTNSQAIMKTHAQESPLSAVAKVVVIATVDTEFIREVSRFAVVT